MKRFLRYLCFYCASRLVYDVARAGFRKHRQQPAACLHNGSGALLSLLAIITVVPLAVFGIFGFFLSR
jgi:hypothetical protein